MAEWIVMVGLPASGKTTRAKVLAEQHRAVRITPDDWVMPLYGEPGGGGRRYILEGRLVDVALQTVRLGTNVILDFGCWTRDERSGLRWLARDAGVACRLIYLPLTREEQLARMRDRDRVDGAIRATAQDIEHQWSLWQPPEAAELNGGEIPGPPDGWGSWWEWVQQRWPTISRTAPARATDI
ncbi:ATP-binding protein [Actinoplanes sp. NPDC051861]|uniref:AAA family ATPase n=1 Tax=Actinoplanes sp. NPDC051861 TaxID=3155170 RepID=UPI003434238A